MKSNVFHRLPINTTLTFLPTVPTPNLYISLSRQSDYLAGSELTITCNIVKILMLILPSLLTQYG